MHGVSLALKDVRRHEKLTPLASSGTDPSGRRFDGKRETLKLWIRRNLSHRCGKWIIDLDAVSTVRRALLEMARERMTQLSRTAVIPQLALGNDRKGA